MGVYLIDNAQKIPIFDHFEVGSTFVDEDNQALTLKTFLDYEGRISNHFTYISQDPDLKSDLFPELNEVLKGADLSVFKKVDERL